MKTRLVGRIAALVIAGALLTSACGSSNDDNKTATDNNGDSTSSVKGLDIDYSSLSGSLNGGGSSFQNAFEETARGAFSSVAAGATVNYDGTQGSGGGKNLLLDGSYQFAGTDSLLNDAEKAKLGTKEALYFPIVAAPLAIVFNVSGVTSLNFSADTLAKIFDGKITTWNDAAIHAENSTVTLPSTTIKVAVRDSGSGSTNNLSGFLMKAAPDEWTLGRADLITWPRPVQPNKGSGGIAQFVKANTDSIGYVDFSDAKNTAGLSMAKVKNAAGEFVAPSLDGVEKALAAATLSDNLTYDPLNQAGTGVYPIATPTYIVTFKTPDNKQHGDLLKAYLNFIYTDGQDLAADAFFSKLPDAFREKAIAQLSQLAIPAS